MFYDQRLRNRTRSEHNGSGSMVARLRHQPGRTHGQLSHISNHVGHSGRVIHGWGGLRGRRRGNGIGLVTNERQSGVMVGANVTIKNGNALWEGVTLEDGVFVGPRVFFTNDLYPRSPLLPQVTKRYSTQAWRLPTLVK